MSLQGIDSAVRCVAAPCEVTRTCEPRPDGGRPALNRIRLTACILAGLLVNYAAATPPCEPAQYVCDVADLLPETFAGCFGDVDGNGTVNSGDRGFISTSIGQSARDLVCLHDLDGNGTINAGDRGFVSANVGRCVPLPDFMNGSGFNQGRPDPRFIDPCSGNLAPVARAGSGQSSVAGESLTFDASASTDDGGCIVEYAWSFGDGATAQGMSVAHAFSSAGSYTAQLTVRDYCGATATDSLTVTVSASQSAACPEGNWPPLANAGPDQTVIVDEPAWFSGLASFDIEDATNLAYEWDFGDGATGSGPTPGHTYTDFGTFTVRMTATDTTGCSTSDSLAVDVEPIAEQASMATLVGFVEGLGVTGELAIQTHGTASIAYVTSREFGLSVVDITNPLEPEFLWTLGVDAVPASATSIAAASGKALLGTATAPAMLVDISDPHARPQVLREFPIGASDVAIHEGAGYLITHAFGMSILDLETREVVGFIPVNGRAIEIRRFGSHRYAFVAGFAAGLLIVDVTDPSSPVLLDVSLPVQYPDNAAELAIHTAPNGSSFAYVGAGSKVYIFDITDPANASSAGVYNAGGVVSDLSVASSRLNIALTSPRQLRLVSLASPTAPIQTAVMSIDAVGAASLGAWMFVSNGGAGLTVIDAEDPSHPEIAALVSQSLVRSNAVGVDGPLAFVGSRTAYTRVVRTAPDGSAAPEIREGQPVILPFGAEAIATTPGHCYVVNTGTGLHIVDTVSLQVVGELAVTGRSIIVEEIAGSRWAFIGGISQGLRIVNVDNPSAPVAVDLDLVVNVGEVVGKVAIHRPSSGRVYVYASAVGKIHAFDASSPAATTFVGSITVGGTIDQLAMAGDKLLATWSQPGRIMVFDLTVPAAPALQGYTPAYSSALSAVGSTVYSAALEGEVQVFDLANRSQPELVHTILIPGQAGSTTVRGNRLFVGDESAVLDVVDLPN